ncbi:MAG: hypothetical protein ACE5GE_08445 [Phycisphaerae bacterium]
MSTPVCAQPTSKSAVTGRGPAPRYPTTVLDRVFSAIEQVGANPFCVQLVVRLNGRLDERLLARAVRLTLEAEPYLGCRFLEHWFRPFWEPIEDLDSLRLLEVCPTDSWRDSLEGVLSQPIDRERECAVKVVLLRDTVDVLCVKLDHKMGDGQAAKDYAYLLAQTYSRLADDSEYAPSPNPNRDRSLGQIPRGGSGAGSSAPQPSPTSPTRDRSPAGQWYLPRPPASASIGPSSRFLIEQIPPERHAAVFRYACRHRATVSQVLLASFIRAALLKVPHSASGSLRVRTTLDLRRYLPSKQANVPCNLAGLLSLRVDPAGGDGLDEWVGQVRDQMYAARAAFMGRPHRQMFRPEVDKRTRWALRFIPFALGARLVFGVLPFRWFKRIAKRQLQRGAEKDDCPSRLMFTDIGPIRADRLGFSHVEAVEAFVSSGTVMLRGLMLVSATEFCGTLTLSLGYSPLAVDSACMEDFFATLVDGLPA